MHVYLVLLDPKLGRIIKSILQGHNLTGHYVEQTILMYLPQKNDAILFNFYRSNRRYLINVSTMLKYCTTFRGIFMNLYNKHQK